MDTFNFDDIEMVFPVQIKRFLLIAKAMKVIVTNDSLDWETKFRMVFSVDKSIANQIKATGVKIEWLDYDTTYQEDVMQYYNAVQAKAEEYKEFLIEAEMNMD